MQGEMGAQGVGAPIREQLQSAGQYQINVFN